MIPATLLCLPFFEDKKGLTFGILILCVFGFSIAKGIALAGSKAVVGEVAGEKNAAGFFSIAATIGTSASILTGIVTAIIIRNNPSPVIYAFTFVVGIFAGFASAFSISHLPSPKHVEKTYDVKLTESLKQMMSYSMLRRFLSAFTVLNLAFTLAGAFIIVFYKDYYGQTDSNAMILTVLAGVGVITSVNLTKKYLNRKGSKRLLVFASIGKAILLLILIMAPVFNLPSSAFIFIATIHLFIGVVDGGRMMFRDVYFLTIVKPEQRINFSIIMSVALGISGIIGSSTGGFVLQSITDSGLGSLIGYRVIFSLSVFVYIIGIILCTRLKSVAYVDDVELV